MGRAKHRHRRPGHFCWCCERRRPNERFSAKGHARHICKECSRLPAEEKEFRQAQCNIFGIIQCHTIIGRKMRRKLERFYNHPNERVRRLMEELEQESREEIERRRQEELAEERWISRWESQTISPAQKVERSSDPVSRRDQ